MADLEEKRETGATLMFIGVGIWAMDFLVLFFLPSASKSGTSRMFVDIIATMAVVGLALLIIGYRMRGKSRAV